MENDNQSGTIKVLLECITAINAYTHEEANLEGIYSGRQIAQALITIDKRFAEDDEFTKIAEYETDEEISQEVRIINYERIISKLPESFNQKFYDYDNAYNFKFEPTDIVERRDEVSLTNLLITIVAAALLKEIQITTELKQIMNDCGDIKTTLNELMRDFYNSIKISSAMEPQSGGRIRDTIEFKRKQDEWIKKEENWKRKEEEFRTSQIQLQTRLEACLKDVEEYSNLKAELADRDAKIKHLEMLQMDSKEQERITQNTITNMEIDNDKNSRKIKQMEETLHTMKREKQDLMDEIENRSSNENKCRMEIKRLENKIVDVQTQMSNSQNDTVSRLQKELETAKNRIQYFIAQVTEMESQKNTILNLEQRLENNKHQLMKTNAELDAAVARACQAEEKLQQTETELHRKTSSNEEVHLAMLQNNFSTPTLHDELNLSLKMHQNKRDEHDSELIVELKTKNEQYKNHINQLTDELKESRELYEKLSASTDARIAAEKEKTERIEGERQRLVKIVADLESVKSRYEDKIAKLEEGKKIDTEKIQKLEKHIDSARMVISTYSSVSDGRESSAENLKLRNEVEKLQKEVENLRLKMDQYRCEACQEQRIITSNWYDEKIKNFALIHGLGSKAFKDSMSNSNTHSPSFSRSNQSTPINPPKSFITRQLNIN